MNFILHTAQLHLKLQTSKFKIFFVKIILFIILQQYLILHSEQLTTSKISYNKEYTNFNDGVQRIKSSYHLINTSALQYNISTKLICSIIFPEACRYNKTKEYLEKYSNEFTANTKLSTDFSIGLYQIKPSFVKKLLLTTANDTFLSKKYYELLSNSWYKQDTMPVSIIKNLSNVRFCTTIICLFIDYKSKELNINLNNINENGIRILATAYNSNFLKDINYYKIMMTKILYPYGITTKYNKYNYSDMCYYLYLNFDEFITK